MIIARITIYNKAIATPLKVIDIADNEKYLIGAILTEYANYRTSIIYF